MEAKQVRKCRTPQYPTKLEVLGDPKLLEKHAPPGWVSHKELACGLAVLLATGSVGCTACIVVAPPVYISEEEVVGVIVSELEQYGVSLRESDYHISAARVNWTDSEEGKSAAGGPGESTVIGPITADLQDSERNVVVEFVSAGDCREWAEKEPGDIRFGNNMKRIADALNDHVEGTDEEPLYFHAFYDPAHWYPKRDTDKEKREKAKRYLRYQLREFAEWLKAQGVI